MAYAMTHRFFKGPSLTLAPLFRRKWQARPLHPGRRVGSAGAGDFTVRNGVVNSVLLDQIMFFNGGFQ